MELLCWFEHVLTTFFFVVLLRAWFNDGLFGVTSLIMDALRHVPGYKELVERLLRGQVEDFTRQIKTKSAVATAITSDNRKTTAEGQRTVLPKKGISSDELLAEMGRLQAAHKPADESRLFAYVYTSNDEGFQLQQKAVAIFLEKTGLSVEHDTLMTKFYSGFMHENALSPMAFPALRKFEIEIISMTSSMLHGDSAVVGSLTSGGTESLLMAMKTYRDRARSLFPRIKLPNMVAPVTIHPAHEKAAEYFGFSIIHVPVGDDGLPDVNEYEAAITPNTIALLCSAPQYCHGVVDPVSSFSEIACRRGLPLHVDACFGGFMLPWVEKLGYPVPWFDFRLPGVTSISADLHKYGFSCKGASVILYRDETIRKHQFFVYSAWPGGLFGSPSMAGTRPGANIAAAWCTLMYMGEEGYINVARNLMTITERLKSGIKQIPCLRVIGSPHMTSFAVRSADPDIDILALADIMESKGWTMERQQRPNSIHFSIMPHHETCTEKLIADFSDSVNLLRADRSLAGKGSAGLYGMMAKIPDKSLVNEFILEFFNQIYKS